MGKVDVWLKRSYIIVMSVIAIIGALLLGFTMFSHGFLFAREEMEKGHETIGLSAMYGISIISVLLVIIGLYGACKEKQWALIVFAVGMILSCLFMIISDINGLASRPQLAKVLRKQYLDELPLTNASENFLDHLQEKQTEFQCCGLDQGYLDWGDTISESCLCTEESTNPCVEFPTSSSLIYKEPCLPYLVANVINVMNTLLGVMLGITLLWVLSVVLCITIVCRLRRKEATLKVVYSPEAKEGNFSSLADAAERT